MQHAYYTQVDLPKIFKLMFSQRNREFAFWYKGDIMQRKLIFADGESFKKAVLAKLPERIEVGAIYDRNPGELLLGPKPVKKELTIDIDLTDMYILTERTDPSNPSFQHAWLFLVAAVRILTSGLSKELGFKHILCVFSGRRGVHLWVSDERAMCHDNSVREAIFKILTFKGNFDADYPFFERCWGILQEDGIFLQMVETQGWFRPENLDKTLELLKNTDMAAKVKEKLSKLSTDTAKDPRGVWGAVCNGIMNSGRSRKRSMEENKRVGERAIVNLGLRLAYPILDKNVTVQISHLLKMPFMVHPKTGLVSVPINPATMHKVDVNKLPTMQDVCKDSSRLQPYKEYFESVYGSP